MEVKINKTEAFWVESIVFNEAMLEQIKKAIDNLACDKSEKTALKSILFDFLKGIYSEFLNFCSLVKKTDVSENLKEKNELLIEVAQRIDSILGVLKKKPKNVEKSEVKKHITPKKVEKIEPKEETKVPEVLRKFQKQEGELTIKGNNYDLDQVYFCVDGLNVARGSQKDCKFSNIELLENRLKKLGLTGDNYIIINDASLQSLIEKTRQSDFKNKLKIEPKTFVQVKPNQKASDTILNFAKQVEEDDGKKVFFISTDFFEEYDPSSEKYDSCKASGFDYNLILEKRCIFEIHRGLVTFDDIK